MASERQQTILDSIVSMAYVWLGRWKNFPQQRDWYREYLVNSHGWVLKWGPTGYCMAGAAEVWEKVAGIVIGFDSNHNGIVEWSEKTATPSAAAEWAKTLGIYRENNPVPGCIVFTDEKEDGTISHAGIVTKVHEDGTLTTVEFNFGGDIREVRRTKMSKVVGYAYPDVKLSKFI